MVDRPRFRFLSRVFRACEGDVVEKDEVADEAGGGPEGRHRGGGRGWQVA